MTLSCKQKIKVLFFLYLPFNFTVLLTYLLGIRSFNHTWLPSFVFAFLSIFDSFSEGFKFLSILFCHYQIGCTIPRFRLQPRSRPFTYLWNQNVVINTQEEVCVHASSFSSSYSTFGSATSRLITRYISEYLNRLQIENENINSAIVIANKMKLETARVLCRTPSSTLYTFLRLL